jgi:hypothetical protein
MHAAAAGNPSQRPAKNRPSAGAAGGHRGALLLVVAPVRQCFDVPIGGPDAPRPLME